jgi:hypothetical protein
MMSAYKYMLRPGRLSNMWKWGSGVFASAWVPVRSSFSAHFVACFCSVFPEQPGHRELFQKPFPVTSAGLTLAEFVM